MSNWPHDNQAELLAFYGNPKTQVPSQLVKVVPPFQFYYTDERGTKKLPYVWFHRKAAPALLAALNDIWDGYGKSQDAVDTSGVSDCGGTYNPRMVRGSSSKWSNHAYGAAIDLNAKQNGMYTKGNMPELVKAAFKKQGFRWGGDYTGGRTDPMHFEACQNAHSYGIMDAPTVGDNGFDEAANDKEIEANDNINDDNNYRQRDDATRPMPWYKKVWNWVSGGGVAALGGFGIFSGFDPSTTIVAMVIVAGLIVFGVLIFTKRI